MGGVRRIPRQSLSSANAPSLSDNYTIQETTTYNELTPADSPAPWGGTVADLDRVLTATGSSHTALGLLLTFVHKPDQIAGALIKIQPTYSLLELPALELWSLAGATWTKRRRVLLPTLVRSGETLILDLTTPLLDDSDVDAYWITLAPTGTETLTWLICHAYGVCNNDPETPNCPPGTPPEDCDAPECGVDFEDWVCLDPPIEPTPGGVPPGTVDPPPVPPTFTLPPIEVPIPFPPARLGCSSSQPPFNILRMSFGELPSGGSVTVRAVNTWGVTFVEGVQQVISAPGDMDWTVASGFNFPPGAAQVFPTRNAWPAILGPLYPRVDTNDMIFTFTRQLDGSVFEVAGNLLDILIYFWTTGFACTVIC